MRAAAHGGEPMQEQVFWKELRPVGHPHWSSLFLKGCTLWKGPMLEQFLRKCNLREGCTLEYSVKDFIPWEGSYTEAGKSMRKEQQQRRLWTYPNPHFLVPHAAWGEEEEAAKLGLKLSLGERVEGR